MRKGHMAQPLSWYRYISAYRNTSNNPRLMLIPAQKPHTQLLFVSSLFICFFYAQSAFHVGSQTMNSPSVTQDLLEQGVIWLNESEVRSEIGYPDIAKKSGITGQVNMEVLVNESGAITSLQVTHSDHPLLEVACVDKLILSKFASAIKDGSPISAWTSMKFSFQ